MNKEYRIVISGTYSTGKTTTATALSIATGIPLINALSAREILTDLFPGRRFEDMNSTELMALGLRRLEERIREETISYMRTGNFITDGSVLNEWIYGTVRMKLGINPGAKFVHRFMKNILGLAAKPFFKKYMEAYGIMAKAHSKLWYTHVIHLPVEFEMNPDGHRPVSEKYRMMSDLEIIKAFDNIGMQPEIIGGSQLDRLQKIQKLLSLDIVVPLEEAIKKAEEVILKSREEVSRKIIEQYKVPTLREKIDIMSKF